MPDSLLVILGNQLFPLSYLPKQKMPVFMAEDSGLCTHFKYHKHKLILFLAAMREHAADLKRAKWQVDYRALSETGDDDPYEAKLADAVRRSRAKQIVTFEIEDKWFEARLGQFCEAQKLDWDVLPSPMFLTSREEFADYLRASRKPFMRTFYESQRKRLELLMNSKRQPLGGQFSFDVDNRKPLPTQVNPPALWEVPGTNIARDVAKMIDTRFADHPGKSSNFWLPTTRKHARQWLDDFVERRLEQFGPYEDAIPARSDFVFHSVLSPILNLGLITPAEVIESVVQKSAEVPLASLEGFVRQVIGWREFIRGIYQNFSEKEDRTNFWNHRNRLSEMWYRGDSGIPPLDNAIAKVNRYGWCHHIERLMVLSNLMLLCGIAPREGHRWFMEMFVDSSDWVMGPNVYGMGLFSDGGLFATKPYICGSNYLLKMSDHPRGEWCDVVDGLYWSFVEKHAKFFERNPRTPFLTKNLAKLSEERKRKIYALARDFRKRATTAVVA